MNKKKFCTHCGASLPQDARFCQACGASTTETHEPPVQTVRYGMRESRSTTNERVYELGKTLTIYLTLFIVVIFLLVIFWPIGIIAFFAWIYIIYKHRQGKRVKYRLSG